MQYKDEDEMILAYFEADRRRQYNDYAGAVEILKTLPADFRDVSARLEEYGAIVAEETARDEKKEALQSRYTALRNELSGLGVFAGKRKREIREELDKIQKEMCLLQG